MAEILFVSDGGGREPDELLSALEREFTVQTIRPSDRLVERLADRHPSLIVWDCTGHKPRLAVERTIAGARVPFIALLRRSDWRESLKFVRSAADFVLLPAGESELPARICRLLDTSHERAIANVADSIECARAVDQLIGDDPGIMRVKQVLPVIASAAASVLITGETGTGKELVARSLHYLSPRRDGPLLPVNCGAIPVDIFESELFGHAQGAFTGAVRDRRGYLAEAHGGTLFLDELDAIPPGVQVKLLRALQTRTFRRVGGEKTESVDVRIIAATNTHLPDLVEQGRFRADLYYRLNIIPVHIPPLRERRRDIPMLANHFLQKYATEYEQSPRSLTEDAMGALTNVPWRGNVRELENVIHRLVVLTRINPIDVAALESHTEGELSAAEPAPQTWQQAKKASMNRFEREYLIRQLKAHGGNITQAAQAAGTDRRVFGRMVKRHGLGSVAESARRGQAG